MLSKLPMNNLSEIMCKKEKMERCQVNFSDRVAAFKKISEVADRFDDYKAINFDDQLELIKSIVEEYDSLNSMLNNGVQVDDFEMFIKSSRDAGILKKLSLDFFNKKIKGISTSESNGVDAKKNHEQLRFIRLAMISFKDLVGFSREDDLPLNEVSKKLTESESQFDDVHKKASGFWMKNKFSDDKVFGDCPNNCVNVNN